MKVRPKILPTVCCIALLSACASNQAVGVAPFTIKPITAKNSSDNPEAMYQMGRYYQGQNRYDLAIAAYQKALVADGSFVEARNGLGVIYSKQGKYREAIEAFQAAIQRAPKAAHIYSNLGYAYYLQGQYGESVAALEQATVLDPANQRALNNLGLAYAKAGSKGDSIQAFAQAANVSAVATTADPSAHGVVAEVPSQGVSALPAEGVSVPTAEISVTPVSQPMAQKLEAQKLEVQKPDVQILALPKDRGVIKLASALPTIPVVDSRVNLVQLAPNVHELHTQQYSAEPIQTAAVADIPSVAKLRVEVANGNGVLGMAGKVGQFLRSQGYPAARLTNQKPFQVRMTQIQYRSGHQAEAQYLQSSMPGMPQMVQRNDMRADVGVRLVLGKDMTTHLAHFGSKREKLDLALALTLNALES